MKINPKKAVKELNGKDSELTIGQAIANILIANRNGGKLKMFVLAQKLYAETKPIEIDAADLTLIKQAAETTEIYNNLVAGQVLKFLEDLKE